jgi:micrococcal nuclease
MKKLCLVLLVMLAAVPALAWSGKVVGVPDGDDLRVLRVLGAERVVVKIRLHGIDAPEKQQAYGMQAKKASFALAFGRMVEINEVDMDRYGRTVAEVTLPDRTILNRALVALGMGWWYQKYAPNDKALQSLEARARKAKVGLWQDPNPTPPWRWRAERRQPRSCRDVRVGSGTSHTDRTSVSQPSNLDTRALCPPDKSVGPTGDYHAAVPASPLSKPREIPRIHHRMCWPVLSLARISQCMSIENALKMGARFIVW